MGKIFQNRRVLVLLCIGLAIFATTIQAKDEGIEARLILLEQDGKIVYKAKEELHVDISNEIPRPVCGDEITVSNQCKKEGFELYCKAVPVSKDKTWDKFFEKVTIKISKGKQILYNGELAGKDYEHNGLHLQNQIFMGRYEADEACTLDIECNISSDIPKECYDLLGKTDWQFTIVQKRGTGTHIEKVLPVRKQGLSSLGRIWMIVFSAGVCVVLALYIPVMRRSVEKFRKRVDMQAE